MQEMSATAKDRAEYNKVALGGAGNPGWATINDVRDWDDMDEYDGGDHIRAPINCGPIGTTRTSRASVKAPTPRRSGRFWAPASCLERLRSATG
jgi:hypothetical protein